MCGPIQNTWGHTQTPCLPDTIHVITRNLPHFHFLLTYRARLPSMQNQNRSEDKATHTVTPSPLLGCPPPWHWLSCGARSGRHWSVCPCPFPSPPSPTPIPKHVKQAGNSDSTIKLDRIFLDTDCGLHEAWLSILYLHFRRAQAGSVWCSWRWMQVKRG